MRLHYHPASPYSRKAYVAALLQGDVKCVMLDVRGGALRTDAYRALSPFGKMPVLETDDGPLIESTSIVEYLEDMGIRILLPIGSERIARHFDRIGDHYLTEPQVALWFRTGTGDAERAPHTIARAWKMFADQLSGRDFVAGSTFTLGDLGAAIATDYIEAVGIAPPPVIAAWVKRCFDIPVMARAREEAVPMNEFLLARRARRMAEQANATAEHEQVTIDAGKV